MNLLMASSLLAFIGFKTRWSISLFTMAALYIFGVPQLYGKINHNHHLVWFPAILAFSGCGDFLSADCVLKNKSLKACVQSRSGSRYGRAFAGIWLLMGVIYFFPGFRKIWVSGLDWVFSDNLLNFMYQKSIELPGWQPLLPLQELPLLASFFTAGAVVFEIGFIFAITHPLQRRWAALAGLLFHLGTWLTLNIFFIELVLSYAVFVNWEKWFGIQRLENDLVTNQSNRLMNTILVVLLAGNILFGVLNVHSWPFSAYPAFAVMSGTQAEALEFEATGSGGRQVIPPERFIRFFPSERFRDLELRAIGLYREKKYTEAKTLLQAMTGPLNIKDTVRVYIVKISWSDKTVTRRRELIPILELY
jgi:hypothetical protein